MKIPEFPKIDVQYAVIGRHKWAVSRLIELSKTLKVLEIPIDHLNVWHKYEDLSLRKMVMHIQTINNADLEYPIILDEDGEIMDGRHRIMKALLEGRPTVKAVRFDENPSPCEIVDR